MRVVLLIAALLTAQAAPAAKILYDFTAKFGSGVPNQVISGSVEIDGEEVSAIDLAIDGFAYDVAGVVYEKPVVGGTPGGIGGVADVGVRDFFLGLSPLDPFFGYTDVLTGDFYYTADVTVASSTAVPELASWAMMIAGLGSIGTAMRKRKAYCNP